MASRRAAWSPRSWLPAVQPRKVTGANAASIQNADNGNAARFVITGSQLVVQQYDTQATFFIGATMNGTFAFVKAGPGTVQLNNNAGSFATWGNTYVNAGCLKKANKPARRTVETR